MSRTVRIVKTMAQLMNHRTSDVQKNYLVNTKLSLFPDHKMTHACQLYSELNF